MIVLDKLRQIKAKFFTDGKEKQSSDTIKAKSPVKPMRKHIQTYIG